MTPVNGQSSMQAAFQCNSVIQQHFVITSRDSDSGINQQWYVVLDTKREQSHKILFLTICQNTLAIVGNRIHQVKLTDHSENMLSIKKYIYYQK
jgi:hypothetical protein